MLEETQRVKREELERKRLEGSESRRKLDEDMVRF